MTDLIRYKNSSFKIRIVAHNDYGSVYFGSTNLCNKIIDDSGSPISKEAEMIDDLIFFYISPPLFKLSDTELKRKFF